jgi:Flp pilus assembly protein CpaB
MPTPGLSWRDPQRRARLRRTLRRVVLSRRRPLAALCAAIAVAGVVQVVRPGAPATVAVTVAAHDLASGTVLSPGDLEVRRFAVGTAPSGTRGAALAGGLAGRTLAGPVTAGEPITDVRLVAPSLLAGYPGRVALPVRIADADAVGLLRAGDHVDLVAADPRRGTASYVAIDVPILSLPPPSAAAAADSASASGRLVVVAAEPSEVEAIAGAAATDLLSVVLSH